MESTTRRLNTVDYLILGVSLVVFLYVYIGFYQPGIYVLSYGVMARKILLGFRVILPIIYLGAVLLYVNARLRHVAVSSVVLLSVVTVVCLVLAYDIADYAYQGWFDAHKKRFHPYLQLMPPTYVPHSPALHPVRIFCLGGSTTEWSDSSGHDWPSRVDSILRTTYGRKDVEVSNLGMEWYTSLHSLIDYETNLRPYKPAMIVVMQSVNDLLHNADFSYFSHGSFREDYGHFYGPVNRIIDRRSLWRYLSDVLKDSWYAKPRTPVTTDVFPGLAAYDRNIRTLIELARHDSTQVVLMSEPFLLKEQMSPEELSVVAMLKVEAINDTLVWSPQTVINGMQQYNARLAEIAESEHVGFIDLEKVIPKTLTFFRDEVHYKDTTFSVIAPYVAQKINDYLGERQR